MSRNKIDKPDFFTLDWMNEQKKLGKSDPEICEELFISEKVLKRWKKEVGFVGKRTGRRRAVPYELIKEMRLAGKTYKQIQEELEISEFPILTVSRMMKEGKI